MYNPSNETEPIAARAVIIRILQNNTLSLLALNRKEVRGKRFGKGYLMEWGAIAPALGCLMVTLKSDRTALFTGDMNSTEQPVKIG